MVQVDWLKQMRQQLERLGAEISEQQEGLFAARLPVRGGVFRHPLTRQPLEDFLLYPAGIGRVKILLPRFLWSLEAVELEPSWSAENFFAAVAGRLGQVLAQLDGVRRRLAALGLTLDLQAQVLQLSGQAQLGSHRALLAADRGGRVVLLAIDGRSLHAVDHGARSHALGAAGLKDLEVLSALAVRLVQETAPEAPVLELTEVVEQQPQAAWIELAEVLEKLGSSTRMCVSGGVLLFEVTLRVVQGQYRFRLQHQPPAHFNGWMLTPAGQRVAVSFDLQQIMDLKDVLDNFLRGR